MPTVWLHGRVKACRAEVITPVVGERMSACDSDAGNKRHQQLLQVGHLTHVAHDFAQSAVKCDCNLRRSDVVIRAHAHACAV